jgi:hypothetical protein
MTMAGTASLKSTKTMWNDFGLHARVGHNPQGLWAGMLEEEEKTEIPTGMAVSLLLIKHQLSQVMTENYPDSAVGCETSTDSS